MPSHLDTKITKTLSIIISNYNLFIYKSNKKKEKKKYSKLLEVFLKLV